MAWTSYVQALYSVADASNVGLVDLTGRWPSNAACQAAPDNLIHASDVHPVDLGDADIAHMLGDALSLV